MPGFYHSGHREPKAPTVGRPKRDRSRNRSQRRARKGNRR